MATDSTVDSEPRNVVVCVLDSVRKDFFDEYATHIPGRADVDYAQCRAASGWSTPSHASMFTGELPSVHGLHTHDRDFTRLAPADTFLAALPDHRSVGVSANVFAGPNFGFDGLFDEFVEVSTGKRYPDGIDPNRFFLEHDASGLSLYLAYLRASVGHDHPLQSLANGVLAQVNVTTRDLPIPKLLDDGAAVITRELRTALVSAEPTVAFANFGDAHVPLRSVRGYDRSLFDAPHDWSTDAEAYWDVCGSPDAYPEYLDRHRDLYGAAIEYLDRRLDRFVDRVQRETDRPTTVIVTADHGENLGYEADDGLIGHKSSLSEALLHVPMYVVNAPDDAGPAGGAGPTRIDDYVSHLDLGELTVGLARGTLPDVRRSQIVAEVLGMSPGPDLPTDQDRDYWDRAIRCAYEASTKYVWDSTGTREQYRLDPDRPCWQELVDPEVDVPAWALQRFETDVETARDRALAASEDVAVDASTEQRLEDLGYL